jgi:hypothetical protein
MGHDGYAHGAMHPALATAIAVLAASQAPGPAQDAPAGGATHAFGAPLPAGQATDAPPTPPKPSPRPDEPPTPGLDAPARLPAIVAPHGTVWPHDPGLAKLEAERDALEAVDHAAHHASLDAARRIAAMHAFIDERNLESDWARFAHEWVPTLDQLTFDDAVDAAMRHAAGMPKSARTNDVEHLEQAIEVEAGVARASWNQLNRQRRSVDALSAFLDARQLLAVYQAWAPGYMRRMGWKPPVPPSDAPPPEDAMRRRGLQMEWDRAHRTQRAVQANAPSPMPLVPTGIPPVGSVPAEGGAPDASPAHGIVPQAVAQGASPARGPYSNSWWNGYADPYYDMAGYPGRDPNLTTVDANDPATYAHAPEAYTYRAWPMYWDIGWVSVPPVGMFGGGAVGATGFGFGGGAVGGMGAAGGK